MKRSHGDGGIDERGDNVYRLRYWISGFTKTVRVRAKTCRTFAAQMGEHVQ